MSHEPVPEPVPAPESVPESVPLPEPLPVLPHPGRRAVWLAVMAAVCLGLAWPVAGGVAAWLAPPPRRPAFEQPSLFEHVRMGFVQAAAGLWVFAVAATIGSFLNVVVHRLPAGRSVVFGRSACPACGSPVLARDNVPIFGWLWLGGHCRGCGAEIAARYPIVEAVCGGMLMALWFAELLSGGATLPVRPPNTYVGLVWIILYPKWDLIGLFLYHAVLLCLLLVWSLVAIDRRRLPVGHAAAVGCLMTAAALVWPGLHPVPLVLPVGARVAGAWPPSPADWLIRGLMVSLVGMAVGGLVAAAIAAVDRVGCGRSAGSTGRWQPSGGLVWSLLLVGVVLGWQAVLGVGVIGLGLLAVAWVVGRVWPAAWPLPPEIAVLAAVFIHLLAWRWIVATFWQ